MSAKDMYSVENGSSFMYYRLDNGVTAEIINNLIIVNEVVKTLPVKSKPEFYILGGAALNLHGIMKRETLDIDIANSLDESIRESVDMFISDQASSVTYLGEGYKKRASRFMRQELDAIDVYLLSQEDLLLTKVMSGRAKDIKDIMKSKLLSQGNVNKAEEILKTEYPKNIAKKYVNYMYELEQGKRAEIKV